MKKIFLFVLFLLGTSAMPRAKGMQNNMTVDKWHRQIHNAVENNKSEILRDLLDLNFDGASPCQPNYYGNTLIYEAAYFGYTECLRILLADPRITSEHVNQLDNSYGNTPIFWAASRGHTKCLRILLADKRTTPEHVNQPNTSIYEAAFWGHTDCANLLRAALAGDYWISPRGAFPKEAEELVEPFELADWQGYPPELRKRIEAITMALFIKRNNDNGKNNIASFDVTQWSFLPLLATIDLRKPPFNQIASRWGYAPKVEELEESSTPKHKRRKF